MSRRLLWLKMTAFVGWASVVGAQFFGAPASIATGLATAKLTFVPPACGASPFADVGIAHPHCAWIQQFVLDGIASGCGGGRYCPEAPVTHGQLAMYLERAMRGTPGWHPAYYQRTFVVSPVVTGGSPTADAAASGARFLAVLSSIPTDGNPYLVRLEPGVYDIGSQQIPVSAFLTIEGSGASTLVYTSAPASTLIQSASGLLVLRDLELWATNGLDSLTAIQSVDGWVILERVGITIGSAGDTQVLRLEGAARSRIVDSRISAGSSSQRGVGVHLQGEDTDLEMVDSRVDVGAGTLAYGLLFENGRGTLTASTIRAGSGGTASFGVALRDDAILTVKRGEVTAAGPGGIGLFVQDSGLSLDGGSYYGGWVAQCASTPGSPPGTISIQHATLSGGVPLFGSPNCTITATFTSLEGGAVTPNGGTINCLAVVDVDTSTFLPSSCP